MPGSNSPSNVLASSTAENSENKDYSSSSNKKDNSKQTRLIIMFGIGGGILLILILATLFLLFGPKGNSNTTNSSKSGSANSSETFSFVVISSNTNSSVNSSSGSSTDSGIPYIFNDRFVYTDKRNVFLINSNGTSNINLTNFSELETDYSIGNVEIVDRETIGFYRCANQINNWGCVLYKYNIQSKKLDVIKNFLPGEKVAYVAYPDLNNASYLIDIAKSDGTVEHQLKYFSVKNNTEKLIAKFTDKGVGRRTYVEDDLKIKFAADLSKLFFVDTNLETGADFEIFVYNLNGEQIDKIDSSTNPEWLDNTNIIYRGYSEGYLYKRDVNAKTSSKLSNSTKNAHNPRVLGKNVIYWDSDNLGKTYLYNLTTNENRLLKDNFVRAVWLSSNEVIGLTTKKCDEDECSVGTIEGILGYKFDLLYVRDINKATDKLVSNSAVAKQVFTWLGK